MSTRGIFSREILIDEQFGVEACFMSIDILKCFIEVIFNWVLEVFPCISRIDFYFFGSNNTGITSPAYSKRKLPYGMIDVAFSSNSEL